MPTTKKTAKKTSKKTASKKGNASGAETTPAAGDQDTQPPEQGSAPKSSPPAKKASVTRFRSKHRTYRVGNVQFTHHIAEVDNPSLAKRMQENPYFGPGKDFWLDETAAAA